MAKDWLLPKRVVRYIQETGVRALDALADRSTAAPAAGARPVPTEDKEKFVERVAGSLVEVIAASAALPLGLKAIKAAGKVIKKQRKRLRKNRAGKALSTVALAESTSSKKLKKKKE
jgi:hypothetical protein